MDKQNIRSIATNKKARFNYEILDTWEAGIILTGPEVKSLRAGRAQIAESYIAPEAGRLMLINAYIAEYDASNGGFVEQNARRSRELLLHQKERQKLAVAVRTKGQTLVPLDLYFNSRGLAKIKIALCVGKNVRDKRETIKQREWKREQGRIMRTFNH
ncbi:MAG: SsrA-binding protein SmpB [Alphaproteobacteria bacterium]|nr:SsrA-binding protein SmpB [Alphaproteobacteria bacterium]